MSADDVAEHVGRLSRYLYEHGSMQALREGRHWLQMGDEMTEKRAIWKYALECVDVQRLLLPTGAEPLYAAGQDNGIVLYVHVYPYAATQPWMVWIHGTGHTTRFPPDALRLGVVPLHGGALMFHVFAKREERER